MKSNNPTAGSAEPNWFEWQTGLLSLVEMLDENSEVRAVAFQLHGTKGWDDVGVRYRDGRTRLMQMKHSRRGDKLTFGDLIAAGEDNGPSLLRALACAWKEEHKARGNVECVLVTNRRAGPNWYDGRPPLADFFEKMKGRVAHVASLDDVRWDGEDERYPSAWAIFLAELGVLEQSEQFAFLQALWVETSAPDLAALEANLHERLSALTGLPRSSVHALFNALVAHLRKWTCHSRRDAEWLDCEALRACLASDEGEPPWLGHCEVETPEPFFPSRLPVVETLRASLLSDSAHKVDFLSAEPGAGKTSCTSKLARSGAVRWQEQCVSIRYYAYRPIRPGQPDVGIDAAAGVGPEALWLGLLCQIRDHLRKTHLLAELRVPVWLEGMPWVVAREHVLRVADSLGRRWGRPFIVCIDGIDHAARAQRKHLPEFLGTLPAPDAIPAHVRFFLAGQPADSYPEYPFFLRHPHASVKKHPLDTLTDEDLRLLWRAAQPRLSVQADDAVLRLLAEKTQRRTLPTVYAVEDIRASATLEEAAAILDARPLADSLHHYYDVIWSAATATTGDSHRLAAVFALLRERPTGELMSSAFSDLGKSAPEWSDILRRLRPLVRETAEGFELVHNDLRVHLDARLAGEPFARRDAASALASHYRKPESNRLAAHRSLLDLLATAERQADFADDFTVDWVIEAGALGLTGETLPLECSAAFAAAVSRQDWRLLHGVACASLTMNRLHECVTTWSRDDDPLSSEKVPAFLPVEGEPRSLELWSAGDFFELVAAGQLLVDSGAVQRAAVVLKQWVGSIPLEALVRHLVGSADADNEHQDVGNALCSVLERFGQLCAVCCVPMISAEPTVEENSVYLAAAETGWVRGLTELHGRRAALRLWCRQPPRYLVSWLTAVKGAAVRSRWGEVRALLNRMERNAGDIKATDRHLLGWYASRSKPKNTRVWSQPFTLPDYGLAKGRTSLSTLRIVAQWVTYTSATREPGQVTEELLPMLDRRGLDSKNPSALALLVRASAVIGRMLRYRDRSDFVGVAIAVPSATLKPFLESLWCREADWRNLPHDEVSTPREIGNMLAEIAWECGPAYRRLLHDLAAARFSEVMLWDEGPRIFDMLWECGERGLLAETVAANAREIIARLHEDEAASRNSVVSNLLHFARRLEMSEVCEQLSSRLRNTRIGYGCRKEWVFQPLVRWFEILRKHSPSLWKAEGAQLLSLDLICEQQGGDNRYSDELTAEVGAAAMACGPDDFEALFGFLAAREATNPLWDLAKAAQDSFEICLREGHIMSDECTLARVSIAIALGRWPEESALKTVSALLTAHGVPPALAQQPAWQRAVRVAAEIQGKPARVVQGEAHCEYDYEPAETSNAETILAEILQPTEYSWMRLRHVASLAERANIETLPNRDALVASALGALESADAFSRCVEFHDISLMSRLYSNLTEPERWRLLGAITSVTGDMRTELNEPNWAFVVAFAAVNLTCRARAAEAGHEFALAVFQQLLGTHWKWHGVPATTSPFAIRNVPSSWPDAARRMLLLLTQTDGCETLYMVMCGLRFFAEVFPEQIPTLCREGLAEEHATDALLALAQMWATRQPCALAPALPDFLAQENSGTLDERLDAWAVSALHCLAARECPRKFSLPPKKKIPEIAFPGDGQLFETDAEMNGLMRHNSVARMANERLRRVSISLGSMERAYRQMTRAMKETTDPERSFYLRPIKRLAFDSNYPRPSKHVDNLVGNAMLHQCAGHDWSPDQAAAVRLLLGYGMDPWIASATPNPWPDKKAWPSDFDVERWLEAGASKSADVSLQIAALLEGHDLAPSSVLLGAVLHIPTYRRDLEFRFWLTAPSLGEEAPEVVLSSTPSGRTLAGWLSHWSFAATPPHAVVSVHFVGTLVNYPNSNLDLTPTSHWMRGWRWLPDPENALRFRSQEGILAAWHERWIGPDVSSRRTHRQPLLHRWVAHLDRLPAEYDELRAWARRTTIASALLSHPE